MTRPFQNSRQVLDLRWRSSFRSWPSQLLSAISLSMRVILRPGVAVLADHLLYVGIRSVLDVVDLFHQLPESGVAGIELRLQLRRVASSVALQDFDVVGQDVNRVLADV